MDERQKKVMTKAEAEIEIVLGKPPFGGEPEIDAVLEEQAAANRMRWQLYSRVFNDDRYSTDILLDAADTAARAYIDRFGVVK